MIPDDRVNRRLMTGVIGPARQASAMRMQLPSPVLDRFQEPPAAAPAENHLRDPNQPGAVTAAMQPSITPNIRPNIRPDLAQQAAADLAADTKLPQQLSPLLANAATMFGAGAGQSSSNPLTLDQQRQMGMEPQRVDQWGKPLAEAAGPKMETRADGLQGLATTYSPGSQPSLRSSAGVAPEPITPQQAPSTAANTGLPRMIANERTGGGINVMPQGAGTFS